MSKELPQEEIDARFRSIVAYLQTTILDEIARGATEESFVTTLKDHWQHLKNQGYSDEEIRDIFDLVITEGEIREI